MSHRLPWASDRLARAIDQLGKASPPELRRLLELPAPPRYKVDPLVVALEAMRRRGEMTVTWSELGNALFCRPRHVAK